MTDPELRLVDAPGRERIKNGIGARLAVSAAAGSGKTRSLIDRVLSILASGGVRIGSVAAITFTEAAAAELRTKLRRQLLRCGADNELLAIAARDIDDAAICTIHSFALRILSENWLEAGLPPRIEVLDSAAEYLDHQVRMREFTTELLADETAIQTLVRAFSDGFALRELSKMAQLMSDEHHRFTEEILRALADDRARTTNPPIDVAPIVLPLERAIDRLGDCPDSSDLMHDHLCTKVRPALERLRPLLGSTDEAAVLAALRRLGAFKFSHGKRANWTDLDSVKAELLEAEEARSTIFEGINESVATDLGMRLANLTVDSASARLDDGRLTFHDLLVVARHVLISAPAVLKAVRSRYRCILIDEFQDTDPVQAEIVELLTAPEGDPPGLSRIFVVGDPEQSIYRFRGADPTQFDRAASAMEEIVMLSTNFRSVPEILAFVDSVFDRLGDGGTPGGVSHRSLAPFRSSLGEGTAGPPVGRFGGAHDTLAREVRLRSSSELAQVVRSVVDDAWTVEDESGEPRRARFRDIAVLLPTRTVLPMLERALEDADVPYRLEGATLIWGSQDVRDLLAILGAIEHPDDPLKVVAALRTPALACGDDDLVRFFGRHPSWDPRASDLDELDQSDSVVRAMRLLASLHRERMWMEPSAMVGRVVTELHLLELALVHNRPRDHWQRLRWVQDQSRSFDEAGGGTLGDFLRWVELTEEADRWSSAAGPPDPDDNAVRVMTIHGAKGLEFPIVVLTGLDAPPQRPAPDLLFEGDGVPRFRFTKQFQSPRHLDVADHHREEDLAERRRLLYVALTRARDHLVLDLHHKAVNPNIQNRSFAATLFPLCQDVASEIVVAAPVPPTELGPTADHPPTTGWWEEQERWLARRAGLVLEAARQHAWSATALSKAGTEVPTAPERDTAQGRVGSSERRSDPETQRRIGRAVHDALAKIDLPVDGVLSGADIETSRSAATTQHLDGTDADEVVSLVSSAVSSPVVTSLAARRHWKELPLAAPLVGDGESHVVVEGFADLVGETDDGLVVVDFKTAAGRSSSLQYLWQVAIYAYAIRKSTGRPVTRVVVLYLHDDGADEESLEGAALDAVIDEVLQAAGPPGDNSADAGESGQLVFFPAS